MPAGATTASHWSRRQIRILLLLLSCLCGVAASNGDDRSWLSDQLVGREFTYSLQPGVEPELRQLAESENLTSRIDWSLAGYIIRRSQGIARDVTK